MCAALTLQVDYFCDSNLITKAVQRLALKIYLVKQIMLFVLQSKLLS